MAEKAPAFIIEPFGPHHDRTAFSCESQQQTDYFRNTARQHHENRVSSVHVMVDKNTGIVAGYYTLANHSIEAGDVPTEIAKKLKLPKNGSLPAAIIGRLARDITYRGNGLGPLLAVDAFLKAYNASLKMGCVAVVVDPDGEKAMRFWIDLGFVPFPTRPERLFIPMATIKDVLATRDLI